MIWLMGWDGWGHTVAWPPPGTHQTITLHQLPAAPPSEINLPLASRHGFGHCPYHQTVYNLEKPSSLIFNMRKSMKTPDFLTSFPCSQQGDKAVAPSWFPSVQLGVASSESSFSPPGLPGYALGDAFLTGRLPCLFCMQRLGWNRHHRSDFHLSPEQMLLKREYLSCVSRLPSSAEQHPGQDLLCKQDLELPRRFNSHLGFYFVN